MVITKILFSLYLFRTFRQTAGLTDLQKVTDNIHKESTQQNVKRREKVLENAHLLITKPCFQAQPLKAGWRDQTSMMRL